MEKTIAEMVQEVINQALNIMGLTGFFSVLAWPTLLVWFFTVVLLIQAIGATIWALRWKINKDPDWVFVSMLALMSWGGLSIGIWIYLTKGFVWLPFLF